MRNLASVQKILNIRPIPGADMIEAVDVLGWTVVSQKGIHTIGDLVIYFEVDSFLNANEPRYASFEERFTNWGDKRGMRLKTIKLRKQISQGLILSLKEFPEIKNPKEGDDVTEILKIEKWESLAEQSSNAGGLGAKTAGAKAFPSFIRKTDQERVQNRIQHLPVVKDTETFEESVKLDGSSMTLFNLNDSSEHFAFAINDMEIRKLRNMSWFGKLGYKLKKYLGMIETPTILQGVCSRNIQLDTDGDNHFSAYVRENRILDRLALFDENIAVQGELIGPSIQKNYENVKVNEFYVYDVFDIDAQKYMLPAQARAIVKELGLKYVPVLNEAFDLNTMIVNKENDLGREMVDNVLLRAEGPGMNPGVKREGLVYKSNSTEFSFKAISNSYLLKKDKE